MRFSGRLFRTPASRGAGPVAGASCSSPSPERPAPSLSQDARELEAPQTDWSRMLPATNPVVMLIRFIRNPGTIPKAQERRLSRKRRIDNQAFPEIINPSNHPPKVVRYPTLSGRIDNVRWRMNTNMAPPNWHQMVNIPLAILWIVGLPILIISQFSISIWWSILIIPVWSLLTGRISDRWLPALTSPMVEWAFRRSRLARQGNGPTGSRK